MGATVRKLIVLAVLVVAGFGLAALSGTAISAATETTTMPEAADPSMIEIDGTWYLYGTATGDAHVPVWSSPDRVTWTYQGDALPVLPDGVVADEGMVWAPEVVQVDGELLLYTTLFDAASTRPCVWVATASSATDAFVVEGEWPLVCDQGEGGAIDADAHQEEDGTWWLTWKVDGNCCDLPTTIRSQQLGSDGRSLVGPTADLLTATDAWHGGVVEGPSTIELDDGRMLLVYSGGAWDTAEYATGAAVCEGPAGPCSPVSEEPVLKSDADTLAPGGGDLLSVDGELWLTYHVWTLGDDGAWTRITRSEALAPPPSAGGAQ